MKEINFDKEVRKSALLVILTRGIFAIFLFLGASGFARGILDNYEEWRIIGDLYDLFFDPFIEVTILDKTVIFIILAISTFLAIITIKHVYYLFAPEKSKFAKDIEESTGKSIEETLEIFNRELAKGNLPIDKKDLKMTDTFIFIKQGDSFAIRSKKDLLWAFYVATKHTVYEVKVNTTYSCDLRFNLKKSDSYSFACESREEAIKILETLKDHIPDALYHFNDINRIKYNEYFNNKKQELK